MALFFTSADMLQLLRLHDNAVQLFQVSNHMGGLRSFRQAAACIVAPAGGKPRILCACNIRLELESPIISTLSRFSMPERAAARSNIPRAGFSTPTREDTNTPSKYGARPERCSFRLAPPGYPVGHHGQRGNFGQFLQNFPRAGDNVPLCQAVR